MASGRARAYLADTVAVRDVWGLTLAYDDNAVRRWATVAQNLSGAMSGWPRNVRACLRTAEEFAPEVVVTDFESLSHLYARLHGLPVISLDNIQAIDRLAHPPEILAGHQADFRVAQAHRADEGARLRRVPDHVLLHGAGAPARTPPWCRRSCVRRSGPPRPEPAGHLLVYSTAEGGPDLAAALGPSGIECRVYGVRRSITAEQVEGNLRYRPFSEDGFIEDLRTARGVVTGGRLHAHERVRRPAAPGAVGAGRRTVRAGDERPLPGADGVRPRARHPHRRGGRRLPRAPARLRGRPGGAAPRRSRRRGHGPRGGPRRVTAGGAAA